ncbi:hypothetical protein HNQ59_003733 [Chitinivorax tropicus]|uniref:Uncharacterized protein n=1 Tax=Chitinivorax tropicus TaxID=714531 RepID=A0A840MMP0_9PROT|nr:hypothetical protein [Chitinivorax tropicus]MBB5020414.1 hypothetical protein [Chitinivorax tropicus]
MFPNASIEELTSEEVYAYVDCKSVYLALLQYYSDLYDYPRAKAVLAEADADMLNDHLWWIMNEAWKEYGTLNPAVPYRWLAIAKHALHWNHMPSNFHRWAMAILEKFDLERYQAAYHLPEAEYAAMKQDLPIVLEGLRQFPPEKFAPPLDEENWGLTD